MNILQLTWALLLSSLLVACGGGGSCSGVGWALGAAAQAVCQQNKTTPAGIPGSLSGVAAGGAPLIGNVEITDALGAKRGATIEANGHYAVNVQGMTGPFVLKASGMLGARWETYYSAGLASDVGAILNITPLTDVMVSSIAGTVGDKFNTATRISELITDVNLKKLQAALTAKFLPIFSKLNMEEGLDLLRSVYVADHTKLDALFDLVRFEKIQSSNLIVVKDAVNGCILTILNVTQPMDALPIASDRVDCINPNALDDIQLIFQLIQNINNLFANQLPTVQQMKDSGLFDTTSGFLLEGGNFDQFASEVTSQSAIVGWKISGITVQLASNGAQAKVSSKVSLANGYASPTISPLTFVKRQGRWLWQGDGTTARIAVTADATLTTTSSNVIETGITFDIDPGLYNEGKSSSQQIQTATVTGPGLLSPLVLTTSSGGWMALANGGNFVSGCSNGQFTNCLDVANITENSPYTIVLKNASGTVLNDGGYSINLPKPPVAKNLLDTANFASLDSVLIDGVPATSAAFVPNKTMQVNFSLPSNLIAGSMRADARDLSGTQFISLENRVQPGAANVSFSWSNPLANVSVKFLALRLETVDLSGRKFITQRSLTIN